MDTRPDTDAIHILLDAVESLTVDYLSGLDYYRTLEALGKLQHAIDYLSESRSEEESI